MPVKKKADASSEEAPKKKPRKKKSATSSVAKVDTAPEPVVEKESRTESKPVPRSRREKSGGGGKLLLFVVLIIVVSGTVYVVQKKQTDEVSSKLSALESKLQGKLGELEQGIDNAKEEAEKRSAEAVQKATTKQFTSDVFPYSFVYSRMYSVVYVNSEPATTAQEPDETVVLMSDIDAVKYENAYESGPHITIAVYKKTGDTLLIDWLTEQSTISNVTEETELEEVVFSEKKGYAYTWEGLGMADAVAIDAGEYIFTASAVRFDKNDTVLRDDLLDILKSITF
jgi:cell division protein FtsL